MEWKSTLFGVILGITSIGVESTPKLKWKVVFWISLLRVDSTILSVDFHSKPKWSLIWLLKECISTPAHFREIWIILSTNMPCIPHRSFHTRDIGGSGVWRLWRGGGSGMRMWVWVWVSDQSFDMFLWIKYVTSFGMNTSWTKIFVIFYLEELFCNIWIKQWRIQAGRNRRPPPPLNVDRQCFFIVLHRSKKTRLVWESIFETLELSGP